MGTLCADLKQDLLFACRQIGKQPGFAITAVAILALGIGSSVAVFSLLYQALLRPLPYPQARQLVFVHNVFPKNQVAMAGVSGFDYAEIAGLKDVFAGAGVFYYNDLTLTGLGGQAARHIDVVNASATVFEVLGVKPQVGRLFSQQDDRRDAPKTVLLSDGFWRGLLAANPNVLGQNLRLRGDLYTVIGVMPPSFQFPSSETQVWIPTALRKGESTIQGGRAEKWLHMVARLAPGLTAQPAEAALRNLGAGLASQFPMFYPAKDGWRFTTRPLQDEQTATFRPWLYLAFGAVLSVLLIACINVSGLLVMRASARNSEIAVRMALGASKYRILRQTLTETFSLVVSGCVLGVLLATWAVHLVNLYGPLPQAAAIESWTLLFGIAIMLLSTVFAGALPGLLSAQLPIEQALRGGATRSVTGVSGWRNAIVAVQIALAVTLVFAATELSRSFLNLTRVPAGFNRAQLWTGAIELPPTYGDRQTWNTRFYEPLLARLGALPGIEAASASNAIPFNPSGTWAVQLQLPGKLKTHPAPEAQIGLVFPAYFAVMRIPLLAGREFTMQDRYGSQRVAIIDEELARRYFGAEEPIGKLIATGGMETPTRIVGVAGNVHNGELGGPREPQIYFPELQERSDVMYLVLRTRGADPTAAVRGAIAQLDPNAALYDVRTMDERVAGSLKLRRFVAFLLGDFAAMGALLAAVGLHASLAHLVQLRRREIGIRVALGARPSQVVRIVLARCAAVAGIGLAAGIAGSFVAGQTMRKELFGVNPGDPQTWAVVLLIGAAAGVVAAWWPAQRAAGTEPSLALHEE